MLRSAITSPCVSYIAAFGEALPVGDASVELVSIACAYHWCEQKPLFEEVARALRPKGWLVIYDIDLRGSDPASREVVDRIRSEYWSKLPWCPRNPYFDPTLHTHSVFHFRSTTLVEQDLSIPREDLLNFISSQASTINAVGSGYATLPELESRLRSALIDLFPEYAPRTLRFGGPLHLLQRT
jgi:SAM-dependent methyltransferase